MQHLVPLLVFRQVLRVQGEETGLRSFSSLPFQSVQKTQTAVTKMAGRRSRPKRTLAFGDHRSRVPFCRQGARLHRDRYFSFRGTSLLPSARPELAVLALGSWDPT